MNDNIDKFKYYIIGMINGIPTEDLKFMIKKGKVPVLLEYELPPYFSFIKDMVMKNSEIILQNLTYDNVIKYSDDFRPDIAGYIRHPKGKIWIERLLKQVRFIVENVHLTPEQMRTKFIAVIQAEQKRRIKEAQSIQDLMVQKELEENIQTEELKEILNPTNPKPDEELKSEEIKKKKNDIPDEYGIFYNPHI